MDKIDFLDDEQAEVVEAEAPETPEEQPVETPEEPKALTEPEVPTEPSVPTEPPVGQVEEDAPQPGFVPIAVMLDARDKAKAAEAELAQLRGAQQPEEPKALPDMFEDPEGYTAAIIAQQDEKLFNNTLAISHRFATQQHGKELTDEAVQWGWQRCQSDPAFNTKVRTSPDPIGLAVEEYQRDQIASEVTPDELQAFKAWKAAQAAIPASPTTEPAAPPPKSIGSLPSAGGVGHVPTGPGTAFDGLF
jgi:hypothetical protein